MASDKIVHLPDEIPALAQRVSVTTSMIVGHDTELTEGDIEIRLFPALDDPEGEELPIIDIRGLDSRAAIALLVGLETGALIALKSAAGALSTIDTVGVTNWRDIETVDDLIDAINELGKEID